MRDAMALGAGAAELHSRSLQFSRQGARHDVGAGRLRWAAPRGSASRSARVSSKRPARSPGPSNPERGYVYRRLASEALDERSRSDQKGLVDPFPE
jgi:hypothetical protein